MSLCASCAHLDYDRINKKLYCKKGKTINQLNCEEYTPINKKIS